MVVRLYEEIIHELVDYLPYRWTNHGITSYTTLILLLSMKCFTLKFAISEKDAWLYSMHVIISVSYQNDIRYM